jgi:hypothetical protein
MGAILSQCGQYRYQLSRDVTPRQVDDAPAGQTIAFFGINPSTADATIDDSTVKKWIGFTSRLGASRFVVGNVFAYRATKVKELASASDPFGPGNDAHIDSIVEEADILVPCWGARGKIPRELRTALDEMLGRLLSTGKPVFHFGRTQSGDPMHPLMLGYSTPLVPWPNLDISGEKEAPGKRGIN